MATVFCTFCRIIAGEEPANVHYQDDDIIIFDNQLDWVPVMLLLVPKEHLSQEELWNSGPILSKIGEKSVEMGNRFCPNGFRILSNFGHHALQSQPHGHIHVIGGTDLGLYVRRNRL